MKLHDTMAENRLRFSQRLNEMSEDLSTLVKEVDKNRKQVTAVSQLGDVCVANAWLSSMCRLRS